MTANLPVENLNFDNIVAAIIDEKKRRKNKEGSSQQVETLTVMRGRSMERVNNMVDQNLGVRKLSSATIVRRVTIRKIVGA